MGQKQFGPERTKKMKRTVDITVPRDRNFPVLAAYDKGTDLPSTTFETVSIEQAILNCENDFKFADEFFIELNMSEGGEKINSFVVCHNQIDSEEMYCWEEVLLFIKRKSLRKERGERSRRSKFVPEVNNSKKPSNMSGYID